ncbi:MAG: hypothetical protein JW894_05845 [Bacteroidales bacterium]|nr:hypothetical protein [Bacteroidales bacterium]
MKRLEDRKYLRTVRATWLAEKLDINYARANAILNKNVAATPKEKRRISQAIKKVRRAPTYMKSKNI